MVPFPLTKSCHLGAAYLVLPGKRSQLFWSLQQSINRCFDDFLFAGEAGTNNCLIIMKNFIFCCDQMGFPIASEKTVWPTTRIIYLDLEIDSDDMVVPMPKQKIDELISKICLVKDKKIC